MGTVVDVHCHMFNGDDLPVRGFADHLHLQDKPLGSLLARVVDAVVQGTAPGFAADEARLEQLLRGDSALESLGSLVEPPEQLERDVDAALAEIQAQDPILLQDLEREMSAQDPNSEDSAEGLEGLGGVWRGARRAVRWAKLFTRSRLDLVAEYVRVFDDEVDLAIPMLVDLGTGLGDRAKTTQQQQFELFELLSRATMRGVLPGAGRVRLHPFVGFDPLRELRARRMRAVEPPLRGVERAVMDYGFVGVKLYPPMGWRPTGNESRPGLGEEDARELDRIVDDLAAWCVDNDVPITAHGNDSNHADPRFTGFGGPSDWARVLARHPSLHLNLGHFGGARADEPDDGWPWQIARTASPDNHLYADVGMHPIHDLAIVAAYRDLLDRVFRDRRGMVMRDRLMYGSDWFMLALHPEHDQFLHRYRDLYRGLSGDAATTKFMGTNALAFLGFDDPSNANAARLATRYERYAPDRVPGWLATS